MNTFHDKDPWINLQPPPERMALWVLSEKVVSKVDWDTRPKFYQWKSQRGHLSTAVHSLCLSITPAGLPNPILRLEPGGDAVGSIWKWTHALHHLQSLPSKGPKGAHCLFTWTSDVRWMIRSCLPPPCKHRSSRVRGQLHNWLDHHRTWGWQEAVS